MKAVIIHSIRSVTLSVLILTGGVTAGWSSPCPASPTYSPDFSSRSCVALNGTLNGSPNASYPSFQQPVSSGPVLLRMTPNAGGWAASAWYQTPQVVTIGFSTTFSFQLGSSTSALNADGIAFVIQNSPQGVLALGPGGCGIGFGDSASGCAPATGGIPNSVAIEFNTFNNGPGVDPSNSDVAIQNCSGNGANSVDSMCTLTNGVSDLTKLAKPINLADNSIHVATVTYVPSTLSNCGTGGNQTCSKLDVVLDGVDLFPNGVYFDLNSIGLTENSALVGFTAGTGGDNDDQDILSWTFTPQGQSQTGTVGPQQTSPTTFNFNGGFTEGSSTSGYNFSAQQSSNQTLQMVVTAIPISQAACNALVQVNFNPAECFVYQNGGGQGQDSAVLFEVTCPPNGSCGSSANPFLAELGTQFNFYCTENTPSENIPLQCGTPPAPFSFGFPNVSSTDSLPEVGLLKGNGPDPGNPCTPFANPATPLFQSNQIDTFKLGDTSGGAKGGSGGTTSCWVLTYMTPRELPSATITQPQNGAFYLQGENDAKTLATYTCSAVNAGSGSPVGPYLTVSSCTGNVAAGAQFDTSQLGPHTFTVEVQDTATNTNRQSVNYTVVTGAAPASGIKCNGVYYGTFKGNITVSKGQSCTFVAGGVTGSIAQLGGNLALTHATVGGSIGIIGGSYFIGPSTNIKGDVAILGTSGSAQLNQVCGVSIAGSLSFLDNASPVVIGSGSQSCPGSTIGSNLVVDFNSATTAIYNNTVGGSLLDQGNSQPTQVFNNHISGSLNCQNDTAITGGGNTATKKLGQCATF